MNPRRKQQVVSVRSDFLAERLRLLTRNGRSQAAILEEAVAKLPLPDEGKDEAAWVAELERLLDRVAEQPRRYASMADFDAKEYDERGNPR